MVVTGNTTTPTGQGAPAASIRDVARQAGVSHVTVSRVINHHPNVSPATREKVQLAIEALGFRPSSTARALASGGVHQVTVITSDTSLYGYASTLRGVEEAARAAGVGVAISVLDSAEPHVVQAAVERVSDPREGAVIVLAFDKAGVRAMEALPAGVRTAAAVESIVGRRAGSKKKAAAWAWFDDIAAARAATQHLLQLGHRTVHHLAIPSSTRVGDRQRGWEQVLTEAGAGVPQPVAAKGWSTSAAHAAALDLLRERHDADGHPVTALLCGNDDQALGVLRAARDLGLSVPGDLSVVGFDDVPGAAFYAPSLTTVRFDFAALGRRTFELLGIGQRSADSAEVVVPAPELVVRESSGPPR